MNELKEQSKTEEMSVSQIQELIGLRNVRGDEEQSSEITPEETSETEAPRSSPKLAKNPYLKLLTVAIVTGIGFALIVLFLSFKPSVKLNSVSENSDSNRELKTDRVKTKEELLEEENADLKAKLAIVQQEQLQKIKERLDHPGGANNSVIKVEKPSGKKSDPGVLGESTRESTRESRPSVQRTANANTALTRVNRQPNFRPVYPSDRIGRSTYLPTVSKPVPPALVNTVNTYEDWQRLAQLGNYGIPLARTVEKSRTVAKSPRSKEQIQKTFQPEPEEEELEIEPEEGEIEIEPEEGEIETVEAPITNTYSKVQINPGRVIDGILSTPIVWAEGLETGCVVELQQPLLDEDGSSVLPARTILVFRIKSVHSSGLVIAQSAKAVINGQEYPIPPEALSLTQNGGSPLMARLENSDSGEAVWSGFMTFLTGALGKTGEIMNRATSSSTSSGVSGISQSAQYGDANYIGSILEGGFEPLQEQMQERNKKRQKEILDRGPLWVIEKGTLVQVIVLNSFRIDLKEGL